MQWRYLRLVKDPAWRLSPHIGEYETVLDRLNRRADQDEGDSLSDLLDALGSGGWELVQVENWSDGTVGFATYYFKRDLGTDPPDWRDL